MVFSLGHYFASRTLLWAGHVARMHKNRLPKRPVFSWVQAPRVSGGQEMTCGRSLQRHLGHYDLPAVFAEWAHLAQNRAGWYKLVSTPPFAIGKPFVRQPRGDTKVTLEDKRRAVAQRAVEIAEPRAVLDANNN